jgi:hypothetical protein
MEQPIPKKLNGRTSRILESDDVEEGESEDQGGKHEVGELDGAVGKDIDSDGIHIRLLFPLC